MKLKTIQRASKVLDRIFNTVYNNENITKELSLLFPDFDENIKVINKYRMELAEMYSEKKDGKPVVDEQNNIKLKDPEGFNKEWLEFLEKEVDFAMDVSSALEEVKLSPIDLSLIKDFTYGG